MSYQHPYQHQWLDGRVCALPVGKAVCVGRNYRAHAEELGNAVPESPLLFLKPASSFVPLTPSFAIPEDGECHHEIEIALLIGTRLQRCTENEVWPAIAGITLGLDLTMRDRQQKLKSAGHPWELAKAFDGALPLAPFVPCGELPEFSSLQFSLEVNGSLRQQGKAVDMIHAVAPLVSYMTKYFTLEPGDVVLTGTPAGVARLCSGDRLRLELNGGSRPALPCRFETVVC